MKTIALFAAVTLLGSSLSGQTAQEIVARSDSVRNPLRPFRFTDAVVDYVGGKAHDRLVLTIYSKRDSTDHAFDNLVRYAEPARDAGKMVLFNGTNMWFYDPSSKTSVRISPQQRLIGLASNGDVATVSLARDYRSTLTGIDTLLDADRVRRVAWHLDLVAADRDAVYSHIELWVEQGTYRPVKGKYYADSGRLLKIAYFHRYEEQLGAVRPVETVIIDAVDPNLVTTMSLSNFVAQDIPEAWFQRDFLPRLSDVSTGSEDRDLAAIPAALEQDTVPAPTATAGVSHGRFYLEDAATGTAVRSSLAVPQPGPPPRDWENRTSLDATDRWELAAHLTLNLSGRINLIEGRDVVAGYDFREGYFTWEPSSRTYLEAGRINLHDGVALGFNPTDFFRERTLVDQASEDPTVRRDDRLGTLMVRAEHLWNGAEASIAFAPRLYAPSSILDAAPTGMATGLDRTNAADRFLATAGANIAGLAPQAFLYHEGSLTQVGAALSWLVSQSIVAYAEYAGGVAPSLAERAVQYGKVTGALPATAPALPLGEAGDRFRSDVAAGASWSAGAAKLTINGEFLHHDVGFDRDQWHRWFAFADASPSAAAELWYIRAYANDQQEPMSREEVFLRADRTDAAIRNLEVTAFAFVDLSDGSSLVQVSAGYLASNSWTLAAYLLANVGGGHSEHGSLPQGAGVTVQLERYL